MKKSKLICLLLCVVMVVSVAVPGTLALSNASASSGKLQVTQEGTAVSSVDVPKNGNTVLTAVGEGISGYQWQIRAGDTWVNIQGETGASIKLTYAMVNSLLPTAVRCVGSGVESKAVDVKVVEGEAPSAPKAKMAMRAPASMAPIVIDTVNDTQKPDLDALKAKLDEEKADYEKAQQAFEEAEAKLAEADSAVADAKTSLDTSGLEAAKATQADAQANLDAARAALKEAESAVADAQAALDAAEEGADTTELETVLADAQAKLMAADEKAKAEVPELEEKVKQAEAAVIDAETALNADPNLTAALENQTQALNVRDAARATLETEKNQFEAAEKAVKDAEAIAVDDPEPGKIHIVEIRYLLEDSDVEVAPSVIYEVSEDDENGLHVTVESPTVSGYAPKDEDKVIEINLDRVTKDEVFEVRYHPIDVDFTVRHWQQNVDNDQYTKVDEETSRKLTGSEVGDGLAKNYPGFYALPYYAQEKVAADGSTEVDIYYDRNYYLMLFNLGADAYGVEPIYARYGTPINVGTPTRPGYTFDGWDPALPGTMPDDNNTYTAQWTASDKVKVTVVFWGENADDEEYSYDHSGSVQVPPNQDFTFTPDLQFLICGKESHSHTDECSFNCGKPEHTHSAAECHYADEGTVDEHRHTDSCYELTCTKTEHSHSNSCCKEGGLSLSHWWHTDDCCMLGLSAHTHGNSCRSLTCGKTEHTHSSSCGYDCGKEAHVHSANACGVSCGKTEHTHSNSCYQNGAGMDSKLWKFVKSDTVTVAADGSSIVNVFYDRTEFTFHFRKAGSNVDGYGTITDKWGASIGERWMEKNTQANTSQWSEKSNGNDPWTAYWDIMPAENRTYYAHKGSGSAQTATYYTEDLNGNYAEAFKITANYNGTLQVSVAEDFFDLEGFSKNLSMSSKDDASFRGAKFYYTRNSYKLEYMSSGTKLDDKTANVKYEEPLTKYNITPAYPDNLEPNAYTFEGWYTDQFFQNKVNWDTDKMPASDVMLYAHWVPKTHQVNVYQDNTMSQKLCDTQTIPHGKYAAEPDEPTNGDYTFAGWFYMDGNVEKAFDFENMTIRKDMDIYAKWSSDKLVSYTIRYGYMKDGVLVEIADPLSSYALAGMTKTFDAKGGTELYPDYQTGYFPETSSHSITMSLNEKENEWIFLYVPKPEVEYTVRYVDKETGEDLADPDTFKTSSAIVTANYEPISGGYVPDAPQKRLVVSTDESKNVITFYYTKDAEHAMVEIYHYIQDRQGNDYIKDPAYSSEYRIEKIGTTVTEQSKTIPGFTYQPGLSKSEGEVEQNVGLKLELYYSRNQYPYEFRFLEKGTDKELAAPISDKAYYESTQSQNAKTIPGYTLEGDNAGYIKIDIEDDPNAPAVNNVYTFYYTENEVEINYVAVGPEDAANFGSVTPGSETVKAVNGPVTGSTPTAGGNFRFVGWFKDEGCTQPVNETWVENNHITPQRTGDPVNGVAQTYEAATYYAKFEYNLTSMTISKAGTVYDESDSFIFDVYHGSTKVTTVTLHRGGSITISGLTVGETYTVHEHTTGTRYKPHADQECKLDADKTKNNVTFTNSVETNTWLTSSMTKQNVFNGK